MPAAVNCQDCGEEVVFLIDGEEKRPTEECECGAVYQLKVERIL
jgi:uncharacterized Zn finger protein